MLISRAELTFIEVLSGRSLPNLVKIDAQPHIHDSFPLYFLNYMAMNKQSPGPIEGVPIPRISTAICVFWRSLAGTCVTKWFPYADVGQTHSGATDQSHVSL